VRSPLNGLPCHPCGASASLAPAMLRKPSLEASTVHKNAHARFMVVAVMVVAVVVEMPVALTTVSATTMTVSVMAIVVDTARGENNFRLLDMSCREG